MLSCADATRKLSQRLDRDMGVRERLALRMHVLMCRACRRYGQQIQGLDRIVRDGDSTQAAGETGLSAEKREEIKRQLGP